MIKPTLPDSLLSEIETSTQIERAQEQEKDLGGVSPTAVDRLPCSVHADQLSHDERKGEQR